MKEVYLNNNASTKVDSQVLEAMLPYFCERYGNPSNLHSFGRETREAVEQAREQVAAFLNAKPEEIYFTSGGTESNNLAIKGVYRSMADKSKHVITSSVEHSSVLYSVEYLEKTHYAKATYLKVDQHGKVDPNELEHSITDNTVLVSIMHSNNEVGTSQPIKELCAITQKKGVYFHTDATATAGKTLLDAKDLGVDLLTISAHKFHGPKGVGALYVKEGVKIEKIIYGGEQERGIRAGTENVPGIVGLGHSTILAKDFLQQRGQEKIKILRDYFENEIKTKISDVKINGHPTERVVNVSNISFANVDHELFVECLDKEGIKVSAGSACSPGQRIVSHVLRAMQVEEKYLDSQIRFGLSRYTTKEEIDYTVKVVRKLVGQLRKHN